MLVQLKVSSSIGFIELTLYYMKCIVFNQINLIIFNGSEIVTIMTPNKLWFDELNFNYASIQQKHFFSLKNTSDKKQLYCQGNPIRQVCHHTIYITYKTKILKLKKKNKGIFVKWKYLKINKQYITMNVLRLSNIWLPKLDLFTIKMKVQKTKMLSRVHIFNNTNNTPQKRLA